MNCLKWYKINRLPPEGSNIKNNLFSPPTAHSNSHKFKFSVSFLENMVFNKDETIGSNTSLFVYNKKALANTNT